MIQHQVQDSPAELANSSTATIQWWLGTIIIVGALLIITGAVIALVHPQMLVSPDDTMNNGVRIYAGYFASRNLALALMLLVLLWLRAKALLSNLMLLTALVQLLDACIDCAEGRWAIVPGVLFFGFVFLFSAARLSGRSFWKLSA